MALFRAPRKKESYDQISAIGSFCGSCGGCDGSDFVARGGDSATATGNHSGYPTADYDDDNPAADHDGDSASTGDSDQHTYAHDDTTTHDDTAAHDDDHDYDYAAWVSRSHRGSRFLDAAIPGRVFWYRIRSEQMV